MSDQQELWQKIKDKSYCDPSRRMDFVLLFDVTDGNPNGDPDAGNLPRMDPTTGHGIVTDVCIKRKIRDYLATLSHENGTRCSLYIQSQASLNSRYFDAARKFTSYDSAKDRDATDDAKKQRTEEKEAVASLVSEIDECENEQFRNLIKVEEGTEIQEPEDQEHVSFREWLTKIAGQIDGLEFDPETGSLRYLGEVSSKNDFKKLMSEDEFEPKPFKSQIDTLAKLLADAKPKKSAKQRMARDLVKAKMCELYDDIRLFGAVLTAGTNAGQIRGPMQLKFARSVRPILQQDAAITRCAITKESDRMRKETEFGRKAWLSYGAYRQHGYFNAPLAEQTGVSCDDLARFWEAIAGMFPNSQSASKGEMATQDLIVFVHPNSRGNAPAHRLLDRVTPTFSGRPRLGFGENGEDDEDTLIKERKIEVHRPLRELWGDL